MRKIILGIILGFLLFFLVVHRGVGNTLEQIGLIVHDLGSTIKRFEERFKEGGKDKLEDIEGMISREKGKKK